MTATISIIVKGRVQGVFFRQSTKEKAIQLGLKGTVTNLPDRSVHIIATGIQEQLDQLAAWCHVGPPRASVSEVQVEQVSLQNFDTFNIHRK